MAQKTYAITVKVNGKSTDALPGAKIKFGGKTREPIMVDNRPGRDYIVKEEPGEITFEVAHGADTDIETIRAWVDATVVAVCDSGVTYQMAGAYLTNNPELADGKIPITLTGPPFEQI